VNHGQDARPASGARLYRTGDLARYRPDGRIECLGRIDYQVKLRGFRIELGEIEATLAEHPALREAAVAMQGEPAGDRRLVAYVVGEPPPSTLALRRFLREKLPVFMIPNHFVPLDALPRTSNGKLDRARLPELDTAQRPGDTAPVAPRTVAEKAIAEIWQTELGIDQVSVHDNFLDLG
jgi:acyl-coenzyme A synthetase/AMP-(fatty) acid ligase